MWSWLIPQTENLIEYFGAATGSCSTISCTTPAPPGSAANAIPDNPAITPTEPSIPLAALFRNPRRPKSSALILSLLQSHSLPTNGRTTQLVVAKSTHATKWRRRPVRQDIAPLRKQTIHPPSTFNPHKQKPIMQSPCTILPELNAIWPNHIPLPIVRSANLPRKPSLDQTHPRLQHLPALQHPALRRRRSPQLTQP